MPVRFFGYVVVVVVVVVVAATAAAVALRQRQLHAAAVHTGRNVKAHVHRSANNQQAENNRNNMFYQS
jgi:hypothetical protein